MHRRARFIGPHDQKPDTSATFGALLREGVPQRDGPRNAWYLYRGIVELENVPRQARLRISTDGRYRLHVNGIYVGRGPVRSSPEYQRYDVHEIGALLHPGRNVLAVLAHVYGMDTAWYERSRSCWQRTFGDGGLWCCLSLESAEGTLWWGTDASWRVTRSQAWREDVPTSGWGQDFIEDFDARAIPANWHTLDYDDRDWPMARVLATDPDEIDNERGWGMVEPFPVLLESELPALRETLSQPEGISACFGLRPDPSLPIDRRLYDEAHVPLPAGLVQDLDQLCNSDGQGALVRTTPDCDVAIVLRFDERHAGYPCIELDAEGGEIIECAADETVPGEYAATGPVEPIRPRHAHYLDCAQLFRYTARKGLQHFRKFEWTSVKYVTVVIRNAPKGLRLRSVASVACAYPVSLTGEFQCNDAMLNRLWRVGCRTIELCSHDAWEDCPGREKRQWLGDGIVRYLASAAAFGCSTQPLDRQYLLHGMESQRSDGLLQMYAPGDHHRHGVTIPDFSLHWICAAKAYLLHTGDDDTIDQIMPAVERVLAWFERHIGPNSLLVDLPYWHFIEWAHTERRGESTTVNGIYAGALHAAAWLASSVERGRSERRWQAQAERVAHALNRRCWSEARGVYVDSVDSFTGAQCRRISQHANAIMMYFDLCPTHRQSRIIATIADPSRLRLTTCRPIVPQGDPFDPDQDVVRANTYFAHFVYAAYIRAGRMDLALEAIRRDYGPMIATGTETLWESFEPEASLCHAFSASPVYQLSAGVLGITPTAPGFSEFSVRPQLGDLAEAAGCYPTPQGPIRVSWHRLGNQIAGQIEVPSNTCAHLVAPSGWATERECGAMMPGTHTVKLRPVE